ncbi:hypothetical protein [Candidatus Phytoplasma pruni]|uniref:Uncharacterized protein n=1 Tax=Candidatus Phytoplasma pruni TaxID=479893 RepID=A0A851HCH1_9MOLU|nr:hypothetical protein [Candidatus Phytoplasma pruni]NWN45751.1 hypothetical protein [Candidatus Phytoplasma pruni]
MSHKNKKPLAPNAKRMVFMTTLIITILSTTFIIGFNLLAKYRVPVKETLTVPTPQTPNKPTQTEVNQLFKVDTKSGSNTFVSAMQAGKEHLTQNRKLYLPTEIPILANNATLVKTYEVYFDPNVRAEGQVKAAVETSMTHTIENQSANYVNVEFKWTNNDQLLFTGDTKAASKKLTLQATYTMDYNRLKQDPRYTKAVNSNTKTLNYDLTFYVEAQE